ncbi:hypothetical protein DL89DRAFT_100206 [Linderina pennispora]|uniref:AMP-binding enzyme C-terminal domain-containing protein n=1 Tax=Linderina pennispora TaxID=61395 RepID=A0A1Y1VW47_9FUNG|nr:uncharacterized protein DL89DRAFT_100206 [Linderina pennispora]ORX65519.1 hypothetical protein DL89DRAFT_100206 [Linderina pennispora]
MVGCGGASASACAEEVVLASSSMGRRLSRAMAWPESTSIIAGSSWATPCEGAVGVLYPNSSAMVIGTDGQETGGFGEAVCEWTPCDAWVRQYCHVTSCQRLFAHRRLCTREHRWPCVFAWTNCRHSVYSRGSRGSYRCGECSGRTARWSGIALSRARARRVSAMPVAYIVPREAAASDNTLQQISQWAKTHTGVAVECRAVEAIPKSPAGKVLRYLLGQASAQ